MCRDFDYHPPTGDSIYSFDPTKLQEQFIKFPIETQEKT